MAKRSPRSLKQDEVDKLMLLDPNKITKNLLMEYFANFEGKESQYLPQDTFVLRKEVINKYAETDICKEDIHTTLGRYIFNLFLLCWNPKIISNLGYINETVNGKRVGKVSNDVSQLLLENVIKSDDYFDYMNRLTWFGFANSAYTTPSINYDIVKPLPNVEKRKRELLDANRESLDKGDITVSSSIESELVQLAKDTLKDNPARDLYDSGAKINWDNQYKNMNIMCGPLKDNNTGGYRMIENSFINGLDKEDIAANGDSLITGVYSRAVGW